MPPLNRSDIAVAEVSFRPSVPRLKMATTVARSEQEWSLLDPKLSLGFTPFVGKCTSQFTVMRDARPEASFTYLHPLRSLFARIDPTYDGLDFHMEHPLAALAEYATQPSWHARVLAAPKQHAAG